MRHPPLFTPDLIVAVSIVVGAINPSFWQIASLFDIARACVVRGLFGLGVLIVLAAGELDVSFTAIAALTMYLITTAVAAYAPSTPMAVILLLGAGGGAILGAVNGLLVDVLKAPALIVTIGTEYVIRGFLLTFVGTALFTDIPATMVSFGQYELWRTQTLAGTTAILPAYALVLVVAAIVTWYILNRTLIGRAVFAVGGSPAIAERLGYDLEETPGLRLHLRWPAGRGGGHPLCLEQQGGQPLRSSRIGARHHRGGGAWRGAHHGGIGDSDWNAARGGAGDPGQQRSYPRRHPQHLAEIRRGPPSSSWPAPYSPCAVLAEKQVTAGASTSGRHRATAQRRNACVDPSPFRSLPCGPLRMGRSITFDLAFPVLDLARF